MSENLDRSIAKMKKMFDKMAYNRVSTGDEKKKKIKHLASKSFENYKDEMSSILREANKDCGIERFEDLSPAIFENIIQNRIDQFKSTGKGASSINKKISAIRAFGIGVDKTNIYRKTKHRSHLLDYDSDYLEELRAKVQAEKVRRSGPKSTVMRATEEQVKKVIENIQKDGYDTHNRKAVVDIALLSFATGARISSCLKMKAADIDFDTKTITMVNAKEGLTYYVDMRDEDIPMLKELVKDLEPGQRLFELRTKSGQKMSLEEGRKLVHRYIEKSAEELAKDDKTFSFHSIRKAFALKIMKSYIDKIKTRADVEAEVARLSKRDSKVAVKYERLYKRVIAYRIGNKMPLKDVPIREAITFFTSLQLGHFRNDVVTSYYCTYQKAVKNKK